MDFSQLLAEKADLIVENWIQAVQEDRSIEITEQLSKTAIRNHIPQILTAMATVLCQSEENNIYLLVRESLNHGTLRAEQGFDPREIAREYCLLRGEIFTALQPSLMESAAPEVIRVFRLIDTVVDEASAQCFKSYVDERLRELEQLQSQLALNNQELTRLVRTSQENLSVLAHELKTPLNSIIGYSELFLRESQKQALEIRDTTSNLEHIERVVRNGRQLLHLINNLLELSRYESGRMEVQIVPTALQDLLEQVIEVIEPLARSKNLQMKLQCDRAPKTIFTDPLRLQQILLNLLSNAIRYTEIGTISLECQLVPGKYWSVAVQDTGIGIKPEDQAKIFEPYFQATTTDLSYPLNSSGLGLAIVSRLVKLLHGKIEIASEVNVGSTFTVIFPDDAEPFAS